MENAEIKQGDVGICRVSFKGECIKPTFYVILDFIDDMKSRGWEFETHKRIDLQNGNVNIDYVLLRTNNGENN